jgi:hypothetical protein
MMINNTENEILLSEIYVGRINLRYLNNLLKQSMKEFPLKVLFGILFRIHGKNKC